MRIKFLVIMGGVAAVMLGTSLAVQAQDGALPAESLQTANNQRLYSDAKLVADPSDSSRAAYGALTVPGQVDLYKFTPRRNLSIPVEVLVPTRHSNRDFHPTVAILGKDLTGSTVQDVPFEIPPELQARVLPAPTDHRRDTISEPFSVEKFYRGNQEPVVMQAGQTYYVAVFDPRHYTGDYAVAFGTIENFSKAKVSDLFGQAVKLKFGLSPGHQVPVEDLIGLGLVLVGLIIGLGAVTVASVLELIGRRRADWTEVSSRMYFITTRLTWVGMALLVVGYSVLYHETGSSGVATFQDVLLLIIIFNALFLNFKIRPALERVGKARVPSRLRRRIVVNAIVSLVGWWSQVGLLVWYLIVTR